MEMLKHVRLHLKFTSVTVHNTLTAIDEEGVEKHYIFFTYNKITAKPIVVLYLSQKMFS